MKMESTLVFESKVSRGVQAALTVFLSSVLIALCSKISIPLFFTPVPITLQNSLILFLAVCLGSKKGASAALGLLLQTAMGFSVLSSGAVGLMAFAGPTGGYLFGYVAAAFLTGFLAERSSEKSASQAFLAMAAGNLLMYALGAGYLATFVGWKSAFWLGVAPFFFSDLFKLMIAAKALQRFGWNRLQSIHRM